MVGTGLGLATTADSAVAFGFDSDPGLGPAMTADLRLAAAGSTAATAAVGFADIGPGPDLATTVDSR